MSIPQNVLVTGGCGFLGSNIAAYFLTQNSQVTVIDALFRSGGRSNLEWLRSQAPESAFHFIQADLAENAPVERVFQNHGPFDYICHLGGQVAMTTSLADPRRDFQTNVLGTFNILEAARRFSPDALVAYSSTNKVYGDLENLTYEEGPTRYTVRSHPGGFDEALGLDFASPYGCSKGSADQYVRDWYRNFGLATVVFRHSSIYGGRQFSTFDQGWIGWFCSQALAQRDALHAGRSPEPFTIAGNGKQVRDVLHADDLIRLYASAYANRSRIAGEVFNIGGGIENSLSLLELFDLLESLLEMPGSLDFNHLPRRQSDQNFFVADIRKAMGKLDWKPCVDKQSGITSMLEWAGKSAALQ